MRAKASFHEPFCLLSSFNYTGYVGLYGSECLFFTVVAAVIVVLDTKPQFESKEFTASEDSIASIELMFSALNKQRRPANVSLMIVKGMYQDIELMRLTATVFFQTLPIEVIFGVYSKAFFINTKT